MQNGQILGCRAMTTEKFRRRSSGCPALEICPSLTGDSSSLAEKQGFLVNYLINW
jgi:hypothetical protein